MVNLDSNKFELYASSLYYRDQEGKIAPMDKVRIAIWVIKADALFESQTITLSLRIAWGKNIGDEIYYDLTDEEWNVIKIDKNGWQIIKDSPVLFDRFNQKPQVQPDRNYSNDIFDKYLDLMQIKNDKLRLQLKLLL